MNIPSGFIAFLLLITCGLVSGHEIDQYQLPDDEQFEDLGDHWNEVLHTAVCGAVASLNRDIELANKVPIPAIRDLMLAKYHSKATLAWRVRRRLPTALMTIIGMDLKLAFDTIPQKHPDRIQGYRAPTFSTVYFHSPFPLLPDPRQLGRMTFNRCTLIKVHDNYIGTDKIAHFITMGYLYYATYHGSRNLGNCHEDATRHAINTFKYGPFGENTVLGGLSAGIFSNADQSANYLGLKFFINLTEPTHLKGCIHPPMLQRCGDYWVTRPGFDEQYFAAFVSEHMDEVLNPSLYSWEMRNRVRREVERRADKLLDWYAGNDPTKRNRAYFDHIFQRCKTYFGEEYGRSGDDEDLITLGEVCFADQPASDESQPARGETSATFRLVSTAGANQQHFTIDVLTPSAHRIGDSQTYQIVVSSKHNEDLEHVKIVAEIPKGLHVTTLAVPARFDRELSTLTWQVSTFEAGSEHVFLFIAKAVKQGTFSPTVLVREWAQPLAATTYTTRVVSDGPVVYSVDANRESTATRRR